MTDKEIAKTESREAAKPDETAATETDRVYVPEVDICEDGDKIRLTADMPGVDQEHVDVTVENNVLTVEGTAVADHPEGCELVGQEFGVGKYRRDFTLSEAVDVERIKARVRHGVLDVTIPKREEVKTRKIEIES